MIKFIIPFLPLLILVLFLGTTQAQQLTPHHQKFGIKDGLSSYNIYRIFQDSRGFIWIGSHYGLNRFDGVDFKVYTKEEHGLCNNKIIKISEDDAGMLWILAGDHVQGHCQCIFDPIKEQFYTLEEYTGATVPFDLSKTVAGTFFRSTVTFIERLEHGTYYYEYDGNEIKPIFDDESIPKPWVMKAMFQFVKLEKDKYAISFTNPPYQTGGLFYLNSKGEVIDTSTCPPPGQGYLGFETVQNKDQFCIICADFRSGAINFNIDKKNVFSKYIQVVPNWGEIFGYYQGKAYLVTSDSIKIYNSQNECIHQSYLGLDNLEHVGGRYSFIDRDKNIWFYDDVYLHNINFTKQYFQTELYSSDIAHKFRGIAGQVGKDLLVVDQHQGIFAKDTTGTWSRKSQFPFINYLGLMYQDSILWMGAEQFVLFKYNTISKTLEKFPLIKNNKNVPAIVWKPYCAKDGTIWAGTNHGLFKLDTSASVKALYPFKENEELGLDRSTVYHLHTNSRGTWLCTSTGLYLVDLTTEKVLACYSSDQKDQYYLPAQHIAHLHEDKDGSFWLATKGQGLVYWNPQTGVYKQYTKQGAGLSHNILYGLYEDDANNLWISSDYGLMCFNKETEFVQTYLKEDGITHNEFNTISHHQDENGRLYFGSQNGFVHFHPKDFNQAAYTAPIQITAYSKQNLNTDSIENHTAQFLENHIISITPNDKSVSLDFALLDYHNVDNHQYSYKIEGYDKKWTFQSKNSIQINGLPYGTYELKFRAKAARSNNWVNYPESIEIRVLRPFYTTWWFIAICLALLVGVVYGFSLFRIRQLEQRKEELENTVAERTAKIEEDKKIIEADKKVIEQQAEDLKALDKVKSRFFANISHELRTPLTLILGPLSYILDNNNWAEEHLRRQLNTMQRNGKNLMQLIEEILDLSKLEANKLELLEEATPIRQFIDYIFITFEAQFRSQGLDSEIVYHLDSEELHLLLDRKKMEKILNNFLSNAIKFTPKGGKITLGLEEQKEIILLSVQDTGKGIHPKDLPHIFERFYQSNQAERKLYGGTGIGLALVNEFAELMGGKAYASSQLGTGSQFYFELPKKVVKIEPTKFIQETEKELDEELITSIGTDFTILVVEDNEDMRAFIVELLSARYTTVLTAQNGVEGLAQLQEHNTNIHLIVSDVMMPEMDGLTMLKQIKAHKVWYKIPVIMLTALAAERDKLNALIVGVDDYLTKPFSVNELLIRAQNLLYNYHQRLKFQAEDQEDSSTEHQQLPSKELSATDTAWIKEIEQKIKDSIPNKIMSVEELAAAAFLGKRQLTRKIKLITGLTPGKFIREIQLQLALKQLEDGNAISITEVTFDNGFEQISTFSRLFKKRFGKPPSEYLKKTSN